MHTSLRPYTPIVLYSDILSLWYILWFYWHLNLLKLSTTIAIMQLLEAELSPSAANLSTLLPL